MNSFNSIRGLDDVPRDGMPKSKRKKYLGPEADYYDTCKGKMVCIEFNTSPPRDAVTVRLDWVDRFTIGVRDTTTGKKTMLFKKSIHSIERDGTNGHTDSSGQV